MVKFILSIKMLILMFLLVSCSSSKDSPASEATTTTTTPVITCLSTEYLNSGACEADTFTATYTNNNILTACDGTQNLTQSLVSCVGNNNGNNISSQCAAEVFHKILKSGLRVEQCRLQTADLLTRYLTIMSIIAWRIYWLTLIARTNSDLPCTAFVADEEWKVLYSKVKKTKSFP